MRIDIISIFPGMFEGVFNESIIKRAREKKKVTIRLHDLRRYTRDKHRKVDDRPFGGGSGMVMSAEPIFRAVKAVLPRTKKARAASRVILLCPQGVPFSQAKAKELSGVRQLVLVCGHYEGVDERVRLALADEVISIGDYVLTGGELPAMVVADCVIRLLPGVLGDKNSLKCESFEGNLLEYPQYTRPAVFEGMAVPAVLLSGDHEKIARWRQEQADMRTAACRPDLARKRQQHKE